MSASVVRGVDISPYVIRHQEPPVIQGLPWVVYVPNTALPSGEPIASPAWRRTVSHCPSLESAEEEALELARRVRDAGGVA